MPSGDKQQPQPVKKVALRDLSNESGNLITKLQGSTPRPKQGEPVANSLKVSGMKRHKPDWPLSPFHHQSSCNNSTNGNIVYVRRKLETETGKTSACGDVDTTVSPMSRNISNNGETDLYCQQNQIQKPRVSFFPAFSSITTASLTTSSRGSSVPSSLGMSMATVPERESNCYTISTGMPVLDSTKNTSNLHWKERFLELQKFLYHCDQSSQEEYIQRLWSLSAVGRSKHAVELEKRAINLLLEEGEELRRMKTLNILGKVSPN